MNAAEIVRMAHFESHYWWYKCLHGLVYESLVQNGIKPNARMIDLGCGSGGLLLYLKSKGYSDLEGIDISATAVNLCREKNLAVRMEDMANFSAERNSYEVIICNDVLYFLNDIEKFNFIQSIAKCLTSGGICIMNLPALKIFRGSHDETVGIKQRTNRKEMDQLIYQTALLKQMQMYWPFLLSPFILATRLKQKMLSKLFKNKEKTSDLYPIPNWLNNSFYLLTEFEKKLPFEAPFGSSLFTVWKKI